MCILAINPKNFIEIGLMRLINHRLCHLLPLLHLPLYAPPDYHMQAEPWRQQDAGPPVPEEHCGEFEPVEEEAELEQRLEHRKCLMFVHHDHRIYRVPVIQCIFNKTLPITDPATNLVRCGDSRLLKTTRQKSDVFTLLHKLFQVFVIYRLYAPQLQNSASEWEVKDEPASQTDDVGQWPFLDRVHEHEEAEPQHAVRMYAKDAAILLGDYLFVDDFELVEILERKQVFVDKIDVELAATKRKLDDDQCQQPHEEVKIERYNGIYQNEDGSVEGELCASEEQNRNYSLVLPEVSLLFRLIYHQHYQCSIKTDQRIGQIASQFLPLGQLHWDLKILTFIIILR